MQVQSINNYSSGNSVKSKNPSFGTLNIAPEIEHLLPNELRHGVEQMTSGLQVSVTSVKNTAGKYLLECTAMSDDTGKGFLRTLADSLKSICLEHRHIDCAERVEVVPYRGSNPNVPQFSMFNVKNGKGIPNPANENPIALLVRKTIAHFNTPTDSGELAQREIFA